MFRGRHDHTIDKKGRLSIPSGFRMEIQRLGGDRAPILSQQKDHLTLYPHAVWEEIERDLIAKSTLLPDVQAYQRFVIANAAECPVDNQGRILVPAHQRHHAKLENKVTLAGVLNKIEIWNVKLFQQDQQMTLSRIEEIQVSVDQSSMS
jgi:MraZ protein